MNHWLVKSEPDVYSWQKFVKEGRAVWDGVRNYQARNNLRAMKAGDRALFYHSNVGQEVVGVAKVVKESYPDPTTNDPRWVAVDLAPVKALARPIKLSEIKSNPALRNMALIRQGRLSVMPVSPQEFQEILKFSERYYQEQQID